jgi:hypothetical protein
MTVLGNGWAAAKPTTGSSYVDSGQNARKTPHLAGTLQLDNIIVGSNRTERTAPSGILIVTCVTVATLTWCLLCCNLVAVITLAPLFRPSGVTSRYFKGKILYASFFSP